MFEYIIDHHFDIASLENHRTPDIDDLIQKERDKWDRWCRKQIEDDEGYERVQQLEADLIQLEANGKRARWELINGEPYAFEF